MHLPPPDVFFAVVVVVVWGRFGAVIAANVVIKSDATFCALVRLRDVTTTVAPNDTNRWATARPIPLEPPVTMATRPVRSTSSQA